jgi:hypothetical protein
MWGTSSPSDKRIGDFGNEPDATSISDRGLFRLLAGNLSPGIFRLLQHNLPKADIQFILATCGIFQLPFRIDGDVSFGQYIRSIGMNSPFGAGSQLASLSAPGDSFWK